MPERNYEERIRFVRNERTEKSLRELSGIVGISSRKIEENIKKLKARGVVKCIGPAKGGHWKVL
ncbi:MAG: winged helix DNA-binding protein [Deltaproteobacteria bacterium]|uniref:Winged helix DNA-binding protein n=1 Tax=Candidatus Desulfacyla euxinica TaxID=2841693 RepID=A0A8J6T7W1_9DELT|nr:winged helix DNA-binding protein [Candidatus Desulfacyla euxinica]